MTTAPAAPTTAPKAFAVRFKDLERWSVGSFTEMGWQWPAEMIRPLADSLQRKWVEVDRDTTKADEIQLATLHFTGEMVPRERAGTKPVKGRLWWAEPGDVVYSKIDVRNGAIGIVPDALGRICVTSEYPVYAVDENVADARYIKLLFRTAFFRRKINSMISGASGRKRVQPSDLESVEVPLPPVDVQRAIVSAWERKQAEVADTRRRIAELEEKVEADFLADLGLTKPEQLPRPKAFGVWWSSMARWGVELAWHNHHQSDTSRYEMLPLGEICETGTGSTPSRKRKEYFGGGIPWVKTTDVRENVITDTEETLSEEGVKNCQVKLYPAGSIIMAMYGQGATRGRTAKLGIESTTNQACLVMTDFRQGLLADFVWFYLMARYHDIRAMGSGNNQPNLSAELVRSYLVPLPPLDIQRKLVSKVTAQRQQIAQWRQQAERTAEQARAEAEAMILGEKNVGA